MVEKAGFRGLEVLTKGEWRDQMCCRGNESVISEVHPFTVCGITPETPYHRYIRHE
jgi:hypothetical protein